MRKKISIWLTGVVVISIFSGIIFVMSPESKEHDSGVEHEENPIKMQRARTEYFFNLMRDPATNAIPKNIRNRELKYSHSLPTRRNIQFRRKNSGATISSVPNISWTFSGPNDVGGRTRALAIDQRDPNVIIAGGASGGIWKSTDGGNTWQMKTSPSQNMSVTWVAQDPTNPDTWYYASGEYFSSSTADRGNTASYFGTGLFKSIDNGDTWSRLSATKDTDTSWNSPFDFISRIVVSPVNGDIFFASNAIGIYRSTDGGNSFERVLGSFGGYRFTDITVNKNGRLLAVLSENKAGGTQSKSPGIYSSTDNGTSWTDITPSNFPSTHDRSFAAFAPSAPDTAYVFTYEGSGSDSNEQISFFMLNMKDKSKDEDRSANLPDFGGKTGYVTTQHNYDMVVAVKPDNPDFVIIGGTNLFRSTDGFKTKPSGGYDNTSASQKDKFWIGGYSNSNTSYAKYSNHHPDQHVIAFDPDNPGRVWSGHDGGISVTNDITASSVSWSSKDQGYDVTQFYSVALPAGAADNRLMGGAQDNGTPFFKINLSGDLKQNTASTDESSGDGGYAFFTNNYVFVSSQNGSIRRFSVDNSGNFSGVTFDVQPSGASNQLFIHPYTVDPNADSVMFYPDGTTMWRNTSMDQSSVQSSWHSFTAVTGGNNHFISALAMTTSPANVLYYAASSLSSTNSAPKIYRLDNASSSTSPVDVSPIGPPDGAYVQRLAVNPQDGNEVIAVMSNYNITGLYHTTDGGNSWQAIEGNLKGDNTNPGPSLRGATILPTGSGTLYLIGTSTGIYSTQSLNGSSTQWAKESPNLIGYSIVEQVTSRTSDGLIAVGTHGRGIFLGSSNSQKPSAPQNLTITENNSDVDLSWNAENNISKYYIYRGTDSNNLVKYDSVTTSSTSSYIDTDTQQESYYYQVSAVNSSGIEGTASELAAIYRQGLNIDSNWQLVGSPVASSDIQKSNGIQIVGFSGAYQASGTIDLNKGYWVKSTSSSLISYDGPAQTNVAISLDRGWNMIGGIADTISTTNVSDPNGILSSSTFYRYNNGSYSMASAIKPSGGYWVHADKAGNIRLTLSGSTAKQSPLAERNLSNIDRIVFQRGLAVQSFYVSNGVVQDRERKIFQMPPLAPDPILDVRTPDGYQLARGEKTKLKLTTDSYPVNVSMATNSTSHYLIKAVAGQDTLYYPLSYGKKAEIQHSYDQLSLLRGTGSEMVTQNKLLSNYPNPFNPTTQIRYELSSKTRVRVEVFDVLGRRVRTLVHKEQPSGKYKVQFDGSHLSSGIYFIHLKAGSVSKIQKMTLIK